MDAEEEKLAENKSQLGCMDDLVIAPVLFEGAEELDVVGPYEMFWWMSLFQHLPPNQPIGESDFVKTFRSREGSTPSLFTVEPTTGVYRMSSGMRFVPDFSYDNAPPANMIVAPGGHGSMNIPTLRQNGTIDYRKRSQLRKAASISCLCAPELSYWGRRVARWKVLHCKSSNLWGI